MLNISQKASRPRRYLASARKWKTSRSPPTQPEFSLSVNERRRLLPQNPISRQTKTNKRQCRPLLLRRNFCPHSTARRRLLRSTWRKHPLPLRRRCKYSQTIRIRPLLSSSEIDYSSSNKKLNKNKTTTDIPPLFHFYDLLPEHKIYLYWEVKAG